MIVQNDGDEGFVRRKFVDGGLVRIKIDGRWRGCWLAHDRDLGGIIAHFVDTDAAIELRETKRLDYRGLEVDSITLYPQYVWYSGVPYIAAQTPTQTTQRSLRASDIDLFRPSLMWLRNSGHLPNVDGLILQALIRNGEMQVGIWKQILSPYYKPLDEAIQLLKRKRLTETILTKEFMLTKALSNDAGHWLWHLFTPIAKITGPNIAVLPEFSSEVEDFLRNTKQVGWRLHELE